MKILILENEIYLAQSIASKLTELGHVCDMCSSTKEALKKDNFDVVLLSTGINGQDIYPVIEEYKKSVIILMVSYISNDTVSKPLQAGAKDYILKPFMIEELIRKIEHYQDYERLKKQNVAYEKYLNHTFDALNIAKPTTKIDKPVFISTTYQKYADAYAFAYASSQNKTLQFVSLAAPKFLQEIASISSSNVIYLTDFQTLKKSDRMAVVEAVDGRECIMSSTDRIEDCIYEVIEIKSDSNMLDHGEILPIEDYVKYIVLNYQHKFPDTELSKKLGISRKSLWEKRKKYGIVKKK